MDIETIVEKIRERLAGSGFDRSILIDFGDQGAILIDGEAVRPGGGQADCTIRISLQDFAEIAAGGLDPTQAFMSGRMKVEGDMGAAMALGRVL